VDDHAISELIPEAVDQRSVELIPTTDEHRRAELLRGAKAATLGAALGVLILFLARRRSP
jgi:hypothetical protein